MAGPFKPDDAIRAQQYREVLSLSPGWACIPLDESIAAQAARIRMRYRLRLPDAIQAATAVAVRAWALITHDSALAGIEAIQILGVGL